MQQLIDYILRCIRPNDITEFIVVPVFDIAKYNGLKQDGIMICQSSDTSQIKPSTDYVTIGDFTLCRKNSPLQLDWLKEDNSIVFDMTSAPIYRRLVPPPYETVNHTFIIQSILLETNPSNKNYVEYGVRLGTSIEPISKIVKSAYGVDIHTYSPSNSNIIMNVMSTDTFSETILPTLTYDYAFIDADHSSYQVLKDFEHIYKYINKGGYIFLHDTYPCLEKMLASDYCNDCYKTPILIRGLYPDIQMLTLPLNPGITIIRK